MGTQSSREQHDHSSNQPKVYKIVRRNYAKWEHHSPLASDDVSRFIKQENENLIIHKQVSQNYLNENQSQRKDLSSNQQINSDSLFNKKGRYDKPFDQDQVRITKSQSMRELNNTKTSIIAQQLIDQQVKRKSTYKSSLTLPTDQIANEQLMQKSSPKMKNIKQFPMDLQLVLINQFDLQNIEEIGHGNFGTVYRGLYKGTRDVALKSLNSHRKGFPTGTKSSIEEYDDKSFYDLLNEAHIMTCLQHQNLLRIIGVTFFGTNKQLSLVTDLMINGSLLDYLKKHKQLFLKSDKKQIQSKLNSFSKQIFKAMLYLEQRNIIHRDLAARNCLIDDQYTLKVADFGLTRLTECGLYKGNYRTICAPRWTAPEAIFQLKYTSKSDVWSYGITLWEIYSLGEKPFGNIRNKHIKFILKNSSQDIINYFPQTKEFTSDEIYTHLILPCLTFNITLRPRFKDLNQRIINILN